ncbi:MAG: vWA domain-containing protein [Gammaproteobacteria bacterium]
MTPDNQFGESSLRVKPCGSLNVAIVQFCRVLREHGLRTSPASTLLALEAAAAVDITDRRLMRHALGLSLIKSPEDRVLFAMLFAEYWRFDTTEGEVATGEEEADAAAHSEPVEMEEDLVDKILDGFSYDAFWEEDDQDAELISEPGEPRFDADDIRPEAFDSASNALELRRLARALQEQFSLKNGRRRIPSKHGSLLDFRRSMRNSVRFGGTPIELAWRQKKPVQAKMVLFVDVSRSMASYAKLLIQFATVILRHAWQVELFLFATEVKRISSLQLGDHEFDIERIIAGCGGGTRIGNNLNQCLEDFPQLLSGSRTVALILSDGLDSGDDDELDSAMRRIRAHTRQILWLNPMLGIHTFEQATREMTAALPYIDALAPARDVASLWQLIALLKNGEHADSMPTGQAQAVL